MLDIFILIVLFIFIISGFLRGLKKEIISTLNIISILFLSFLYANDFGLYITKKLKFFDLDIPVFVFTIVGSISIFIISSIFFYFLGKILLYPFLNFENKFFAVEFHGNLKYKNLINLLNNSVDLSFAMGTSALDSAKIGIPTVLVDYSFKKIKNYKFRWIFDTQNFDLAHEI